MSHEKRKYLKILVNLFVALLVIVAFVLVLPRFLLFFMPFVIGWIISLIANPPVRFLEQKLKIKRKASSAFLIISIIALIILGGYLVGVKLVEEIRGFVLALPEIWKSIGNTLENVGHKFDLIYDRMSPDMQASLDDIGENMGKQMATVINKIGTPTVERVSIIAKHIPSILIGTIMCILSAYFFITDREYVLNLYQKYIPLSMRKKARIVSSSLKSALGGYFKAQFKIEIWVYLLVLTGLLILKVEYAALIALVIAFLDFLPFFGAGAIMIPWALAEALNDNYWMMAGLLITWGVGQLVRQIIQPKFVGDSIGMKPLPTLFLLYIGYKIGGVIGIVVAVPIGIILVNLNEDGVFDTPKNSIVLLIKSINRFRKYDEDDWK